MLRRQRRSSAGFREKRSHRTRRRILEASLRVFSRLGFDGASMDDVAVELEATKGLLYYYFRSKQELLQAILEEHPLRATIGRLESGVQAAALHAALSIVARESLRTMRQHRVFVRFLMRQAQASRKQADVVFRELLDRWVAAVRGVIETHLPPGSAADAERMARQLVDITLASFIRGELGGSPGEEIDRYVDETVAMIARSAESPVKGIK